MSETSLWATLTTRDAGKHYNVTGVSNSIRFKYYEPGYIPIDNC
jgi:hypothetical protein